MPQKALVIAPDNEVVSPRVDVEGGYPPRTGKEGADLFLYTEVVDPDVPLRGDEELWFKWVEEGELNQPFGFAERGLRVVLAELVDKDRAVGTLRGYSDKVVTASVPRHLLDWHGDCDDGTNALLRLSFSRLCPFCR